MNRDNAVVLGASGFIGTRLVRSLVQRGARGIRALDIAPPREQLPGVQYAIVDVRCPIPERWAEGSSIIYNLAATHRTPGHPDHEYYDTNVGGALNTVALAKAAGIGTIVFTSSISVYGPCETAVSEVSPLRPQSSYGRSKRLAEQIHQQWLGERDGLRLLITRPGVVFGPGERGNYTALARALRRGYFIYPGRRDTVKSGGYVDELIEVIEFVLGTDLLFALFNFAYPEYSTIEEIVSTFGEVVGKDYRPLTLPRPFVDAAAQLFKVADGLGVKTVIHPDRVSKLVQSTRITPAWLISHGYKFSTNIKVALSRWRDETEGAFV